MTTATAPTSRWMTRRVRFALYALLLLALGGLWLWRRPPDVPLPDLRGADLAVAEAIADAETQIHLSPRSAQAWGEMGELLLASGYRGEAAACLARAAELEPGNWHWPYLQAVALEIDQPAKAIAAAETAAARAGDDEELPRLLLAETLLQTGRTDEAEQGFRQLLERTPKHPRAALGLARLLYGAEKLDECLELLEFASASRSTRKAAATLEAQVHQRLGDSAAAVEALARARSLPRDDRWPDPVLRRVAARRVGKRDLMERVAALRQSGDDEQALAVHNEAERAFPEVYYLTAGQLQLEEGDAAGAEASLRQALELDPESIDVRMALGESLRNQGKHQDAEQVYREVLKREPGYGPAWLQLARVQRTRDEERALDALRSAVRYMPLSAEAHAELADLLTKMGHVDEAARHRAHARDLGGQDRHGGTEDTKQTTE